MIITEFHEPLVIITDYKTPAFWYPYRLTKRLYPLTDIILIGEVNDKSIGDVINLVPKSYRGYASSLAVWYFITRFFSGWYPKTCTALCCEILIKLGLADSVELHPQKLYEKALIWRQRNADTINKWSSSVWKDACR